MRYAEWKQATVNTTIGLRNTSIVLYDCTDTVEDGYHWWIAKFSKFNNNTSDLLLGFIQNLLGNAVRLNALNDKIAALNDTEDPSQ